ncbi:E3 ubiquitin-protein ligase RMA1H1-like isoform X2 [Andrographis paniculata]|uniref:E3 ubiquitin-protein ligase RMA1H1-like isoform X2 n=1 Tax=Andrographis paniculata TaxID=175694 RepID=UPI0021E73B7C|nr:E3 ubiquitin-protein ligase RMA1H1-like isoform X2 [Andrographis paniculata]
MALRQNFGFESDGDVSNKQKWSSVSSQSAAVVENLSGCFDCNICLESSRDPVVTLCGHLFCWPCIYKWLQVQNSSFDSDTRPKCPVCKAYISESSLVPLYGGGSCESEAAKPQMDLAIPQRPQAPGSNALLSATTSRNSHSNQHRSFHQQQYFSNHPFGSYISTMPPPTFGASTTTSFSSPTINMEMEMAMAMAVRG